MLPVTYLESSSTAWITAVANVYTTESRIINVWYGVPLRVGVTSFVNFRGLLVNCALRHSCFESFTYDTILYFYCFVVVGKGNKTQIFKQKIFKPLYLQRNIISML